ncbi:hypothetical protein VDTJJZMW_CDS_0188 [Pseudomonas phage LPS-5]|nr:hypothetical protein vFB297_1000 [Pseudomonas phage vFB297]
MKFNKAQREFFKNYAVQSVKATLNHVAAQNGLEIDQGALDRALEVVNLEPLAEAAGKAFLERVEFKTLVKVDKYVQTEEFINVSRAGAEVAEAISAELSEVLLPFFAMLGQNHSQETATEE